MLTVLLICPLTTHAQHQANKWIFGAGSMLEFKPDTTIFSRINSNPEFYQIEGSAVANDSTGNMLLYTSGEKIWNRYNLLMENGDSLMGSITSTTSALVIPKPGNPDLFYMFTSGQGGYPYLNDADTVKHGIRYSLVSQCKGSGLGEIVNGEKNVLLYKPAIEGMAATLHANGTDVWVATHEIDSDEFVVYKITEEGISTPLRISTGFVHTSEINFYNTIGQMKFSPDGKWLAKVAMWTGVIEIFPFDNETGTIGPTYVWQWIYRPYGFEFSPDGKKYYVGGNEERELYQFDMKYWNGADAWINRYTPFRAYPFKHNPLMGCNIFQLQLAPDLSLFTNALVRIENPNDEGATLRVDSTLMYIASNPIHNPNSYLVGLPSFISSYFDHSPKIEYSYTCFGDSVSFRLLYADSVASVAWDFGDAGSMQNQSSKKFPRHQYNQTGNYMVTARLTMLDGSIRLKERKVIMKDFIVELGPGQIVCDEPYFELDASQGEVVCYTWQDGSHEPKFLASETGWHWVDVRNSGCTKRDSVYLVFETTPEVDLGEDQILCEGDSINIILPATDAGLIWNDMSTGPVKAITQPGLYWVDAFRNICVSRDSLLITGQPYPVKLLPADTVLCDDIPLNLSVEQLGAAYAWDDSGESSSIEVTAPGIRWVDIDLNSCVLRDSVMIALINSPERLSIDTVLCIDNPVLLGIEQPATDYFWSTQETTAFIQVQFPGTYSVSLINDCYDETVAYNVSTEDCNCDLFIPNVFTPNGDDKNVEFKPILNQRAISYTMKIFNRWGKEIYSTVGNPWYGLDQGGTEVSSGVYYYRIEYPCEIGNSMAQKSKQGWVQVIR